MSAGARPRRTALVVALAALALSWVPFVGVALAAAATGTAFHLRRGGHAVSPAPALAVLGVVLSLVYTAGYVACAPSDETSTERRTWTEFDRLFAPQSPKPPENSRENAQ